MEQREVVVVGGGPAGATTAAFLAARGHDVLLLDKARFPREKACSEYTSPAALDVIDSLGARARYEAEAPVRLLGMDIYSPRGDAFRVEYLEAGERRHALTMARDRLDPLLLENAREEGVEVREGVRVRELLMEGGTARGVLLSGPDGGEMEVRSRLVVGADGLHSVVVRDTGVRARMPWPRRLGLAAHYEGVEGLQEHGEMHVHPWGYVGVSRLPGGLASVGVALDMRRYRGLPRLPDAMHREALRLFPRLLPRLRDARQVGRVRGVGPIARRVSRTEGDGWALVGDAAGFTDPFTGEGIYRALKGGELLAETASRALRNGGATREGLAPYARARRERFRHKSLVVLSVQAFVSYPALLEYITPRVRDRAEVRYLLASVLGDCEDPRRALHPGFLYQALRP